MAVAKAAHALLPLRSHDDTATQLRPCRNVVFVCCCWFVVAVGGVGAAGEEEEDGNAEDGAEVGENAKVAKSVEVSLSVIMNETRLYTDRKYSKSSLPAGYAFVRDSRWITSRAGVAPLLTRRCCCGLLFWLWR